MIKRKIKEVQAEIKKTKEDLNAARLEGVMPKTKYYAPKFNKDTKVNLDMSMWITHNISKEERKPYKPKIEYYEEPYKPYKPKYYEATTKQTTPYVEPYEAPKYEAPKYEAPKYEAPKYEVPKYEEPKYEEPKYEEPKYEEKKYEEPKYEEPKYETPSTAPTWEEKSEEPKYKESTDEKYEEEDSDEAEIDSVEEEKYSEEQKYIDVPKYEKK